MEAVKDEYSLGRFLEDILLSFDPITKGAPKKKAPQPSPVFPKITTIRRMWINVTSPFRKRTPRNWRLSAETAGEWYQLITVPEFEYEDVEVDLPSNDPPLGPETNAMDEDEEPFTPPKRGDQAQLQYQHHTKHITHHSPKRLKPNETHHTYDSGEKSRLLRKGRLITFFFFSQFCNQAARDPIKRRGDSWLVHRD